MNPAPTRLHWLAVEPEWRARLKALRQRAAFDAEAWDEAISLAGTQLDFVGVNALDETVRRLSGGQPPADLATRPVRLAILGSSTLTHLHPAIRVGALRRGIWVTTYENDYGLYLQELHDPASALYAFQPDAVLFSFDAPHLASGVSSRSAPKEVEAVFDEVCARIRQCWERARESFKGPVIQQVPLNVHPILLGNNEHRLPGSRHAFTQRLCARMREMADAAGVELLALDERAARDGLAAWHDAALWHRSKQEVTPSAAPMYGELVGRLLAARQGRSSKCLVLDLDNTLWGGVIGDDGMDGIVLGQGSPAGEAFTELQTYARELAGRGVVLAVCSKNDEANAVEPFESHPDMVLKRRDIACFMANWSDKPSNLRMIAHTLSIGLDSLVFVDDNPFERALVRRELPMVAVPEIPEDPALVTRCLSDAGYFEGTTVTQEDRERSGQYQANISREILRSASTDLPAYLRGLQMELVWQRFDSVGLKRTVQLINKTNQFNLTTRRYTEEEVLAVMNDARAFGLQLRLTDRFGDNGIIAIVIGRLVPDAAGDVHLDTWLMSCRVLGRQVEQATMNVVAAEARRIGAARLIGEYRPTKKNGMVKDHYRRMGFEPLDPTPGDGSFYCLPLSGYTPSDVHISIRPGS